MKAKFLLTIGAGLALAWACSATLYHVPDDAAAPDWFTNVNQNLDLLDGRLSTVEAGDVGGGGITNTTDLTVTNSLSLIKRWTYIGWLDWTNPPIWTNLPPIISCTNTAGPYYPTGEPGCYTNACGVFLFYLPGGGDTGNYSNMADFVGTVTITGAGFTNLNNFYFFHHDDGTNIYYLPTSGVDPAHNPKAIYNLSSKVWTVQDYSPTNGGPYLTPYYSPTNPTGGTLTNQKPNGCFGTGCSNPFYTNTYPAFCFDTAAVPTNPGPVIIITPPSTNSPPKSFWPPTTVRPFTWTYQTVTKYLRNANYMLAHGGITLDQNTGIAYYDGTGSTSQTNGWPPPVPPYVPMAFSDSGFWRPYTNGMTVSDP